MNREIKFRAWDKDAKTINYDIIWPYVEDVPLQEFFNDDRWILMQYTGLLDKTGKEIYEGDIVEWLGYEVSSGKQIRPIRKSCIPNNTREWIIWCHQIQNLIESNGTIEVIGNIYENPELYKNEPSKESK